MRKLFSTFILISIFCSCKDNCNETEGLLTQDELSWLSYTDGQQLVFRFDSTTLDTAIVERNISMALGNYEGGCKHAIESGEIEVPFHFHIGGFAINVDHYDEYHSDNLNSASLLTNSYLFKFSDYTPQNHIEVNGIYYDQVYILTDTTTNQNHTVKTVYYTKSNGILRFDYFNGQTAVRIN